MQKLLLDLKTSLQECIWWLDDAQCHCHCHCQCAQCGWALEQTWESQQLCGRRLLLQSPPSLPPPRSPPPQRASLKHNDSWLKRKFESNPNKLAEVLVHLKHCGCPPPPQQIPLVRFHHHLALHLLNLEKHDHKIRKLTKKHMNINTTTRPSTSSTWRNKLTVTLPAVRQ